jgi:hypothetical protein
MDTTPDSDLIDLVPSPEQLHDRLTRALREVDLCRRLLRVAARAERFRDADRRHLQSAADGEGDHATAS